MTRHYKEALGDFVGSLMCPGWERGQGWGSALVQRDVAACQLPLGEPSSSLGSYMTPGKSDQ